jgi:hypothetical protein
MTAMASITIQKTFKYRGQDEVWSNTYHFDNAGPTTQAKWKALADAIIASEKTCWTSATAATQAWGHQAGVKTRDWFYDYLANSASVAGTMSSAGGIMQAGDTAVWLRWPTSQLTSRGKPIYLRSYFHDAWSGGSNRTNIDQILAGQKSALETYGAAWITGFSDGTVTHHRAGPNGAIGLATSLASTYLTTRTLERRGRRRPV